MCKKGMCSQSSLFLLCVCEPEFPGQTQDHNSSSAVLMNIDGLVVFSGNTAQSL